MEMASPVFVAVLGHVPYMFSLMTDFQRGLPGILRHHYAQRYLIPRVRVASCDHLQLSATHSVPLLSLVVHTEHHDRRLPLHLAILEGDMAAVSRLLAHDPSLLSIDAFFCAVRHE
ncbi:Aste57867_2320 [Aphanomyces stellatus]|uniref:Aste57867_2320 protein n=1 Tax=Aphanomyces stellatus TaxID=120398 RepID=A0A485KCY8_9STRA|nr:hypothetical protein As57867_002315 [Aphanomyces stellatus]VFT79522.1 Aste57867_2320 [Aphanomyces stellatus]